MAEEKVGEARVVEILAAARAEATVEAEMAVAKVGARAVRWEAGC